MRCLLLVSGVVESWCVVLYRIGGGGSRPTAPRATTTGEEEEETAWGWGRGRACVGRRRGGERRAVLSGCRRPPPAQHCTALHHVRRAGVEVESKSTNPSPARHAGARGSCCHGSGPLPRRAQCGVAPPRRGRTLFGGEVDSPTDAPPRIRLEAKATCGLGASCDGTVRTPTHAPHDRYGGEILTGRPGVGRPRGAGRAVDQQQCQKRPFDQRARGGRPGNGGGLAKGRSRRGGYRSSAAATERDLLQMEMVTEAPACCLVLRCRCRCRCRYQTKPPLHAHSPFPPPAGVSV